ncbi:hypothetical protein ABH527_007740, partial [Staphylococcus warneri]
YILMIGIFYFDYLSVEESALKSINQMRLLGRRLEPVYIHTYILNFKDLLAAMILFIIITTIVNRLYYKKSYKFIDNKDFQNDEITKIKIVDLGVVVIEIVISIITTICTINLIYLKLIPGCYLDEYNIKKIFLFLILILPIYCSFKYEKAKIDSRKL